LEVIGKEDVREREGALIHIVGNPAFVKLVYVQLLIEKHEDGSDDFIKTSFFHGEKRQNPNVSDVTEARIAVISGWQVLQFLTQKLQYQLPEDIIVIDDSKANSGVTLNGSMVHFISTSDIEKAPRAYVESDNTQQIFLPLYIKLRSILDASELQELIAHSN
jgi:hypothetical protein